MPYGPSKIDPTLRFRKLQQIMRANPVVAQQIANILTPGVTITPGIVGQFGISEPTMHIAIEHEVNHILLSDPQMFFSPDLADLGPGADRTRNPLKATGVPRHSAALASVMEEWISQ